MPTIVIDEEAGPREALRGVIVAVDREKGEATVSLAELSTAKAPFLRTVRLDKGRVLIHKGIPYPRLGPKLSEEDTRVGQWGHFCYHSNDIDLDKWAVDPEYLPV